VAEPVAVSCTASMVVLQRALAASVLFFAYATLVCEPTQALSPEDGCVLVSGASGFVAGHTVQVLLEKGYEVHGTVRSLEDKAKYEFLENIAAVTPGSLKLFEADLGVPNAFDAAARGCSSMLHIASQVGNMDEQAIQNAINGTLAAFQAAEQNKLEKLVVTSSVASLFPDAERLHSKGNDYGLVKDTDWNTVASREFGLYAYSKTQAEKASLAWLDEHKDMDGKMPFQYASIHFGLGIGPQQSTRVTTSNKLVELMLSGQLPMALPFRLSVIDVRDVARAHVFVLEHEDAQGRYILGLDPKTSSVNPVDMMAVLKRHFPDSPIPHLHYEIPTFFNHILARADPRIDEYMLYPAKFMDKHPGYDDSRLRSLGFKYNYRNTSQTLIDAADSMIALGIVDFNEQKVNPVMIAFLGAPLFVLMILGFIFSHCIGSSNSNKTKND